MCTDLGPAQITYYIQIKHAFWKTSRISWLWGAFETEILLHFTLRFEILCGLGLFGRM